MAPNIVPQPKFAEYSVGWICVQQPEFVAARAMLDAEHGVPASRNAADSNSYFLGSIGDHKVVIACLPAGAPGAASAATVAANMQRTFREVRVGLLVGVGSGAPSAADDIRLGDVVVGIPTNETGGVIQFGLAPQDDNVDGDDRSCSSSGGDGDGYGCRRSQFVRTRCLNAPPRALLSALNVLEAEHALNGSRACEYLAQAAQRSPRRKSHFTAPVACSSGGGGGDEGEKREEMDRLYQANNSHVSGSSSNVICGSCAVSMLVQRPRRDSEGPVVHYGVIASGDQEIECGIARDLAEKTLGAICFEREAAGLMDNFPCLVIRGICDYADTHKSVMWQGYAAATASTYAKELLECTPPQEVREMATIVEVMKDVQEKVRRVEQSVAEMRTDDDAARKDRCHQDFLRWLSTPDHEMRQTDLMDKCQEGTGQWFLKSPEFVAWVEGPTRTLLCPGIPGAGMTFMTAIVINYLYVTYSRCDDIGVAVLYCSYGTREEQTKEKLLAGLIRQLVKHRHSESEILMTHYEKCKNAKRRPSFSELSDMLQYVAATYSKIFVVVDALDEYESTVWSPIISKLRRLQTLLPELGLMVTFRPHIAVAEEFSRAVNFEIRASSKDLEYYVARNMSRLSKRVEETQGLGDELIRGIVEAAGGMFLLAKLHLDSLVGKRTVGDIRSTLRDLPRGFDQLQKAYDQTLVRINNQDPDSVRLAQRIFYWIIHAQRPLSARELQAALAVKVGDTEPDGDNFVRIDETIAICAGLVTMGEGSGIIRLIHFTTVEYFKHSGAQWLANTPECIASTCLTYLSFGTFSSAPCTSEEENEARMAQYPLLSYAASNWARHTDDSKDQVRDLAVAFLRNIGLVRTLNQTRWPYFPLPEIWQASGLHHAAAFGLYNVCLGLIGHGLLSNNRDDSGRSPLSLAAQHGHEKVAKLLLDWKDIAANHTDNNGQTPLLLAAENGHEKVVSLLLGREDIAADTEDRQGQTPLSRAAAQGHVEVVKLLLDGKGIAANHKDKNGKTPLFLAAEDGHEKVVSLLLGREDIAADTEDPQGRTPLSWAAAIGHVEVVKLLLGRGDVRADSTDNHGQTPLSWAARMGHIRLAGLPFRQGEVAADSTDEHGQMRLSWAAGKGHIEVAKQLLNRGDVTADSADERGQTPLSWAARVGHIGVAKLLLNRGDVTADSTDELGQTPLSWAAKMGHVGVAELLVDLEDVSVNSKDGRGLTSLSWAAIAGHGDVAKLLLGHDGIATSPTDNQGRIPLSWAAQCGHVEVIEQLISRGGVAADSRDGHGRTPLSWAAEKGQVGVVTLLLGRQDVDANFKDSRGQTPLSLAAKWGNEKTVELLLGQGDVVADSMDKSGRTPLSWAAEKGRTGVVELLLEREDVNVNSQDYRGQTPLSTAAENGREEVMELLLGRDDVAADSKDCNGQTPLSLAAAVGQEKPVKLLIDRQDVAANSTDQSGQTPLTWAAARGRENIVRLLLNREVVAADSADENGRTPLSWAAANGHKNVTKRLLSRADVVADSKDNTGQTPLSWAAKYGQAEVVKLPPSREDVTADGKNNRGQTPVSLAAKHGQEEVIKLLLSREDVAADSHDNTGRTPLSWAAAYGYEEVVRLLLSRGDVIADWKDNIGQTPLFLAARYGREKVARLLLSRKDVNPNLRDSNGQTPLIRAAKKGWDDLAKLFLARKDVVVGSKDFSGRSALAWAIVNGHEEVMELLLSQGHVDTGSQDETCRIPLFRRGIYGKREEKKTKLKRIDIAEDGRDSDGNSPLS